MENSGKVLKCGILGSSNEGVSAIDAAVDRALTNALLKKDGPGSPQYLKENLLNVKVSLCRRMRRRKYSKVFYNTLNQKTINESKTYDPSLYNGGSLWSSLGGVLSLFLGISFAMFFEVPLIITIL